VQVRQPGQRDPGDALAPLGSSIRVHGGNRATVDVEADIPGPTTWKEGMIENEPAHR
jgi:hypothetical protein